MLDEYWTQRFDDAPPIAHAFRDSQRDCWVRFHSLPESKRYAESESEWTTLLERHNAVVSALASDGSKLDLLMTAAQLARFHKWKVVSPCPVTAAVIWQN